MVRVLRYDSYGCLGLQANFFAYSGCNAEASVWSHDRMTNLLYELLTRFVRLQP